MLIRKRGTSCLEQPSRLVLGTIEVKGPWQLKLDQSMSWAQCLEDHELGPSVAKVFQQVGEPHRDVSLHSLFCRILTKLR